MGNLWKEPPVLFILFKFERLQFVRHYTVLISPVSGRNGNHSPR